jgi:FixJ family two-component response regulator
LPAAWNRPRNFSTAAIFDLIVLDIALPGRSGVEWLHQLRDQGFAGDVVLMTAYADLETAIDALRAGAADFLLKPFSVAQMLNAVKRCFRALLAAPRKLRPAPRTGPARR